MPALFIYLIKVNVALLVFCTGYYLVLRPLTFYTLNRIYLLIAIIFSTLYPFVNLSGFVNQHQQIARPMQGIIIDWQGPVDHITNSVIQHDKWFWLLLIFWAGVALLAIRLLVQLTSLYKLHKRSQPAQVKHYLVRVINGNINPFSFWQNIYINPEKHSADELGAILEHEQIHVNEWHTLDILLGELSTIFYWFNPGIWLMKRAIRENIEFITDRRILQKGVDSKAYQYSLLNVNFGAQRNAIVNHFNISTIKKRIIMMNAKKSSQINITRYLFLVPIVVVLLLVFSVSKAEMGKHFNHARTAVTKAITAAVDNMAVPAIQPDLLNHKLHTKTSRQVADTIRKGKNFMIATGPGQRIEYYINNKKVSKADFDAVSPADIAGMQINSRKANDSSKADGLSTVRILTKSFKGVIADTAGGAVTIHNLARVRGMNTVAIAGAGSGNFVYVTSDSLHAVDGSSPQRTKNVFIIKSDSSLSPRVVTGYLTRTKGSKISVGSNNTVVYTDSATVSTKGKHSLQAITVMGYAAGRPMVNRINISSSAADIDYTDKLIVINGKEATQKQLKKVSAADIRTISSINGAAAKALYGDKAKNGAVVITTRK